MEQLKRRGNALYKKKKIDDAIQAYDEALNFPFVAPGKLDHNDEVRCGGICQAVNDHK